MGKINCIVAIFQGIFTRIHAKQATKSVASKTSPQCDIPSMTNIELASSENASENQNQQTDLLFINRVKKFAYDITNTLYFKPQRDSLGVILWERETKNW